MVNKAVCKRISSMLSLYIDNKVTYQQRAYIEDHLANCEECQKKYLYLKSLIKDLKASYKQVLELAVKKQQQKVFSIREHEKFMENVSPYVDNELEAKECFEFRKYLMKSKNAQKELKSIYILQKHMRHSYEKTKSTAKNVKIIDTITKNVINELRNKQTFWEKSRIREYVFSQKTLKIAILSGLVLLGGFEFDQLYKQSKEPSVPIKLESSQKKQEILFPNEKKVQNFPSDTSLEEKINP